MAKPTTNKSIVEAAKGRESFETTRKAVLEQLNAKLQNRLTSIRKDVGKKMFTEGYTVLPNLDPEKYPARPGLEGPFRTKSGKVLYYDPKGIAPDSRSPGAYYDASTDMYLDNETASALMMGRVSGQ